MKLTDWVSVAVTVLAFAGGIYGVSKQREQQMSPHPGTAALRRMVEGVTTELTGGSPASAEVMEKYSSVSVRARVILPSGTVDLGPPLAKLEAQGFKRHAFSQGKYAIVCKGETVVEIDLSPHAESSSRSASVVASWGTAPIFGGTRPTCPAGSR
jgi:hypothetical protein